MNHLVIRTTEVFPGSVDAQVFLAVPNYQKIVVSFSGYLASPSGPIGTFSAHQLISYTGTKAGKLSRMLADRIEGHVDKDDPVRIEPVTPEIQRLITGWLFIVRDVTVVD